MNMIMVVICPNHFHNDSYEYKDGGNYNSYKDIDFYCYYDDNI